jgi:hypothetical protein
MNEGPPVDRPYALKWLAKGRRMGKSTASRRARVGADQQNPTGNVMKSVAALCFVALICSFHEVKAQKKVLPTVDFSAMTCEQFWDKTPPNDRGPFLFWLSGYFGHKNNSPVLDPADFTKKTAALSQYCSKQPNDGILSAAEKTFSN